MEFQTANELALAQGGIVSQGPGKIRSNIQSLAIRSFQKNDVTWVVVMEYGTKNILATAINAKPELALIEALTITAALTGPKLVEALVRNDLESE